MVSKSAIILDLWKKGYKADEIAKICNTTKRYVYNVIWRARKRGLLKPSSSVDEVMSLIWKAHRMVNDAIIDISMRKYGKAVKTLEECDRHLLVALRSIALLSYQFEVIDKQKVIEYLSKVG